MTRAVHRPRPFRVLAGVLLLAVFGISYGIANTPTYEAERREAEARYYAAQQEHDALRRALVVAGSRAWQQDEARKAYGYVYPGEIIYRPIFTENEGR